MTGVQLPHIAFIGWPGAGKSTASELLVKHFEYERLSFAAPLKVACGTTTDRALLQRVGMGGRELHADFWVNLLIDRLYRFQEDDLVTRLTVDDGRFPNEIARLRMEGFIAVRVTAHQSLRVMRLRANGRLQDEAQLDHPAEHQLDDFVADHTITNDDGPDVLLEQLVEILNKERR